MEVKGLGCTETLVVVVVVVVEPVTPLKQQRAMLPSRGDTAKGDCVVLGGTSLLRDTGGDSSLFIGCTFFSRMDPRTSPQLSLVVVLCGSKRCRMHTSSLTSTSKLDGEQENSHGRSQVFHPRLKSDIKGGMKRGIAPTKTKGYFDYVVCGTISYR